MGEKTPVQKIKWGRKTLDVLNPIKYRIIES